jgi:hypothetical protein
MVLAQLLLSSILLIVVSSSLVIQLITSELTPEEYLNHLETELTLALGKIEKRELLATPRVLPAAHLNSEIGSLPEFTEPIAVLIDATFSVRLEKLLDVVAEENHSVHLIVWRISEKTNGPNQFFLLPSIEEEMKAVCSALKLLNW